MAALVSHQGFHPAVVVSASVSAVVQWDRILKRSLLVTHTGLLYLAFVLLLPLPVLLVLLLVLCLVLALMLMLMSVVFVLVVVMSVVV